MLLLCWVAKYTFVRKIIRAKHALTVVILMTALVLVQFSNAIDAI